MNWFKKLFGIGDEMETDYDGLSKVSCNVPMPEVKPCKPEKNISEPVHVIVTNMLEHPQRWKVKIDNKFSLHRSKTYYEVKDTKTGEVFKAELVTYYGYGSIDKSLNALVSWLTKDEVNLIRDTLEQVYKIKKARRLRFVNYKESQERLRLLEIYK